MSLRITTTLTVLALIALSGCDNVHTPLARRTNAVIDMGTLPLPNSANHLHGYRLDNGAQHDHFVYVIEDAENRLVTGVQSNQTQKSNKSSTSALIASEVNGDLGASSPSNTTPLEVEVKVQCETVEQCQRKLAAMNSTR